MTTYTLSALDVALADALARHTHWYAFDGVGIGTRCRICSTAWETAEAWCADSGVCPGYAQPCGLEPVPGAEHRLSLPS